MPSMGGHTELVLLETMGDCKSAEREMEDCGDLNVGYRDDGGGEGSDDVPSVSMLDLFVQKGLH